MGLEFIDLLEEPLKMINKLYFDKSFRLARSTLDQAGEYNRLIVSLNVNKPPFLIIAEIVSNIKTNLIDANRN